MSKEKFVKQLVIIVFLFILTDCSKQTGKEGEQSLQELKNLSIPEGSYSLPLHSDAASNEQSSFSGTFAGELAGEKPLYLWFGTREDEIELKMRFQLIGKPGLKMFIQALDVGPREATCEIENVKDRIGCVVRVKSKGNLYLVRIQNNDAKVSTFRFFLELRASTPVSILPSGFFE